MIMKVRPCTSQGVMTRPSRRRSEETMNERASSCVRARMSRYCRAASSVWDLACENRAHMNGKSKITSAKVCRKSD